MKVNSCENSLTSEMNWTIATETRFYVGVSATFENAALRLQYPAIWPLHFWDSIRVTHPRRFCASRRRPVSTRANLEIKFQRIRLGMPSTLYESQTNLPAYPCSLLSPSALSIFRSSCRLSFRHLRHLLCAGENVAIEIKREQDVEEEYLFFISVIRADRTFRRDDIYRKQYLLLPRKTWHLFSRRFLPPSLLWLSSFVLFNGFIPRRQFCFSLTANSCQRSSLRDGANERGGKTVEIWFSLGNLDLFERMIHVVSFLMGSSVSRFGIMWFSDSSLDSGPNEEIGRIGNWSIGGIVFAEDARQTFISRLLLSLFRHWLNCFDE